MAGPWQIYSVLPDDAIETPRRVLAGATMIDAGLGWAKPIEVFNELLESHVSP
ncbi:hypothetical protein FDG2_0018 [Candidatus Protofrankia californiensis]|uniref:Uncharacterized protein n=1 Tax=Candidatus Protofrankia californiensis TaxID=1839754 RepID=A0A1C3NST6_9ACTN|nr:hypothetical protein FDG2_0018 [Candidatus Protofrankia californiensis]